MKNYRLLLLCALSLMLACDGKEGPMGPPGRDANITVFQSALLDGDLIAGSEIGSPDDFWEINTGINLEMAILTVHVRPGPDFLWMEPTWEFSGAYVNIYNDDLVGPGYEYRISVAYR